MQKFNQKPDWQNTENHLIFSDISLFISSNCKQNIDKYRAVSSLSDSKYKKYCIEFQWKII
jgi:hypothetical protein